MQSWLEGRNLVGKGAQVRGMTASLRILSSKADSNTWESRLPGDFRALYASICWQAFWRCWFHFPEGCPKTVPKPFPSGLLTMTSLCLIDQLACLTWTPYDIYGIFSRERWETVDPTMVASMPHLTEAGVCAKGLCFSFCKSLFFYWSLEIF